MKDALTVDAIKKADGLVREHSIEGDIYMRIHPSMIQAALEAQRKGIIEIFEVPASVSRTMWVEKEK